MSYILEVPGYQTLEGPEPPKHEVDASEVEIPNEVRRNAEAIGLIDPTHHGELTLETLFNALDRLEVEINYAQP